LALNVLEDAHGARRVDDELAAALEVAELRGRRVVEHEHHRRGALRQALIFLSSTSVMFTGT
jgi:hypothetical protein